MRMPTPSIQHELHEQTDSLHKVGAIAEIELQEDVGTTEPKNGEDDTDGTFMTQYTETNEEANRIYVTSRHGEK